jgi:hypothetical protein
LLTRQQRQEILAMRAKNREEREVPKRNDFLREREEHINTGFNVLMKVLFLPPFSQDFFTGEAAGNVARATLKALKENPTQLSAFNERFGVARKKRSTKQEIQQQMSKWMKEKKKKVEASHRHVGHDLSAFDSFPTMFRSTYGRLSAEKLFTTVALARARTNFTRAKAETFAQVFRQLSPSAQEKYSPTFASQLEADEFSEFCVRNSARYSPTTFSILELFALFRGIGWSGSRVPTAQEEAAYRQLIGQDKLNTSPPAKVLSALTRLSSMKFADVKKAPPLIDPSTYRPSRAIDEEEFIRQLNCKRGERTVYEATLAEVSRFYNKDQLRLLVK